MLQVKAKSTDAEADSAPSKREARAGDVLAKLKKRARLDERLLVEPVAKEQGKALKSRGEDGDDDKAGEGEDVVMSSTLQAAKVREGSWLGFATRSSTAYCGDAARIITPSCFCQHQLTLSPFRRCCSGSPASPISAPHLQPPPPPKVPLQSSLQTQATPARPQQPRPNVALCPRATARGCR